MTRRRILELADAKWLRREYEDKERTTRDIGRQLECHHSSVIEALQKHKIPLRPVGRKVGEIDRAMTGVADEFAVILDELTAKLQRDKKQHKRVVKKAPGAANELLNHRNTEVKKAARAEDEAWALRTALIDYASALLLVAHLRPIGKRKAPDDR